ncbi:excisionase family protein, partial [Escherichia coli]|uniref:excisionase family protein n=1 Tax=Escherichia coli TaxID=562 RepID=UPI000ABF3B14
YHLCSGGQIQCATSVEGDPGHYSECLYNIEEIMRWIENQKQPGAKNASSG